ncbi:hypothetical protein [Streptomyces sp. NBC_00328]|uniref:hypothetical protein n=1 Tax=Streptomyces sp. NBC_00328 TaxID=2903646 RepID=UPI002E292BE6|nr:hypothetical protein [Streptomyces sp. NBC_00328]
MDAYDLLVAQCTQFNEGARLYHGARLAGLEQRLARLEETTFRAVEIAADQGNSARCTELLGNLAELRDMANEMWDEIERPCPDWRRFYEEARA